MRATLVVIPDLQAVLFYKARELSYHCTPHSNCDMFLILEEAEQLGVDFRTANHKPQGLLPTFPSPSLTRLKLKFLIYKM